MQFKFLNNKRNYCRLHKLLTDDNTEIIYNQRKPWNFYTFEKRKLIKLNKLYNLKSTRHSKRIRRK